MVFSHKKNVVVKTKMNFAQFTTRFSARGTKNANLTSYSQKLGFHVYKNHYTVPAYCSGDRAKVPDRESKRSATVIDELEKEKGGRLVEREDYIHVEIGGKDSWILRAYATPPHEHDIALTKPLTGEVRVQS